uniref:Uncharacterized protein n=1 Tax=Heterorhabditis bacteriophora TaxID=37862 RepID=A0A1I7WPG2_HETBA
MITSNNKAPHIGEKCQNIIYCKVFKETFKYSINTKVNI